MDLKRNVNDAASPIDQDIYPALFRTFVARGLRATLDNFDADAERLDETVRDRGLHLLSYGLRLDDAWADARDLALALAPHLERQGYRHTWIEMLERALQQVKAQNDDCGAAQIHLQLGRLHILLGDYITADAQLTRAHQLAAAVGDRGTQALALERLGYSAFERSDLDATQAHAEMSLSMVDADSLAAARNWHLLGWVATRHGKFHTAIAHFQRAIIIRQKIQSANAVVLRDLGVAYLYTQQYALACAAFEDAIGQFAAAGDRFGEAVACMNLGSAYWYLGNHIQAIAAYAPCEAVFQQIAGRSYLARLYNNQGLAYREIGEFERASERFDSSLELARGEQDYLEAANVLDSLAGLRLRLGDVEGALAAWQEALAELAHLPEPPRYLYNLIQERIETTRSTA